VRKRGLRSSAQGPGRLILGFPPDGVADFRDGFPIYINFHYCEFSS
jgi:hypothetical protein